MRKNVYNDAVHNISKLEATQSSNNSRVYINK